MGITPIEMYTMVPKSQEASNLKQAEHTQHLNQHSDIVGHINAEIKQNSMKPVKPSEAEKENYRYDAKEKGNGSYGGGGGKKKGGSPKKKGQNNNPSNPRGFDVRI